MMWRRLKQVLIAIDQLLNALLGGYADESLSSRAYRLSQEGFTWPKTFIDTLLWFDEDHCYESYLAEIHPTVGALCVFWTTTQNSI